MKKQKSSYTERLRFMRRTNTLEGYPQIKGYDFEAGFELDRFIESLGTTGIQATELARGINIVNEMLENGAKVYLSMTSNIISSGLRDIIAFLCRHNFVDVIITSAGGLEEDIIKTMRPFVVGSFDAPGRALFEEGVGRIGNIFAPYDRYLYFERFMNPVFDSAYEKQKELKRPLSVTEFTRMLGIAVNDEGSYLYWAAKNSIPVFCPAITDGSIGDLLTFQLDKKPGFTLDTVSDHKKIVGLVLSHEKRGAVILGGGVPKHYSLNANIFKDGLDYAVYITTAQELDASDSGGNPAEAMTWAKLKVNAPNVKVRCEATIVFPLMVAATFAKRYWASRKPKPRQVPKNAKAGRRKAVP